MKRLFRPIMLLCGMMLCAVAAHAEAPCDASIVDSGKFFTDTSAIKQSVAELEKRGAVVRVRTIPSLSGYASLDAYVQHMERDVCTAWQGAQGGRRDNILIVYLERNERNVGLYAGETWREEIETKWPTIQARDMIPAFRSGDFERGVVAGLNSVAASIDAVANPPPSVDLSGLWSWLWGLLGVGLVIVIGLVLLRGVAARNAAREKARVAQQQAQNMQGKTTTLYTTVEESLQLLGSRLNSAVGTVDSATSAEWNTTFQKLKLGFSVAANELSGVRGNPTDTDKSAAEYAAMEDAYRSVAKQLQTVQEGSALLEADVATLQKLATDFPGHVSKARARIDKAEADVEKVRAQGFKVDDSASVLKSCRDGVVDAEKHATEKRYRTAKRLLDDVSVSADKASVTASGLPVRKSTLLARLQKGRAEIDSVVQVIKAGAISFQALAHKYAESSWSAVVGNGTEAENRVGGATEDYAKAEQALENQEWSAAEQLLGSAEKKLEEGRGLIRSIDELLKRLVVAERDAKTEVDTAERDINTADAFLRKYDADTDDKHFNEVKAAQGVLNRAKKELALAKPDYLVVVKLAREANAAADAILGSAQDEKAAADRLRAKAASVMRDAKGEISTASEYIEDHADDVEEPARKRLREAQKLFTAMTSASAAGDLSGVVKFGSEAIQYAEAAYTQAQRAVEDAEDRRRKREEERRRRNSGATSRSTPTWGTRHSGGFGTSSSNSSSSSSSGTGFGGSISFGGSGSSGFGGSSKW